MNASQNCTSPEIVILDMQPITPAIGGGRIRLLGLYSGFDSSFNATYVGSYDWKGESYRDLQISPCLREICIPFSDEHFAAHEELAKKVGKPCIDTAFLLQGNLSKEFIDRACAEAANAKIVIFSHPWLYPFVRSSLNPAKQLIVYDAQNHEGKLRAALLGDSTEAAKMLVQQVFSSEGTLCRDADAILACSNEDIISFCETYGIDEKKCILTPNGVFTSRLRPCSTTAEKMELKKKMGLFKPSLCFIGSNYAPNVEACNLIFEAAKKLPEYQFIIIGGVGDGLNKKKYASIPNIKVCGMVSEQDKFDWLRACDLAINPMISGSGTNIKMFDYMAAGLPIVTTACGARGIPNIENSLYLQHGDSSVEFVESIQAMFSDQQKMHKFSAYGRKISELQYSFERISLELGFKMRQLYREKNESKPFFSVVIPSYERHDLLTRLVNKLEEQTFKDFEIIIIDQSKCKWSNETSKKLDILYCKTFVKGAVHARNTGISLARGNVVAFIDDDCIPEVDWLENARKYFDNPEVVGVEGRIYADNYDASKYRIVSNEGFEGIGFMTANLFVRTKILREVGGFDICFDAPHFREDTDLAWRVLLHGNIPYDKKVAVLHPSHLRTIERESVEERNNFFVHDPLLMKKHKENFVQLFMREGHYKKPAYWIYFIQGMARHSISHKEVVEFIKQSNVELSYIPTNLGGKLQIEMPQPPTAETERLLQIQKNDVEESMPSTMSLSIKSFYNVIRYRLLSHITCGEKKLRYKEKYKNLKKVINEGQKEKIYFCGVHVITKRNVRDFSCSYLFHFPVFITKNGRDSFKVYLFGMEIYKKKYYVHSFGKINNASQEASCIINTKKICIDITDININDFGSGIQRVEKEILYHAMKCPPENCVVIPVYFDGNMYKIAEKYINNCISICSVENNCVNFTRGDILIVPELLLQPVYNDYSIFNTLMDNGVLVYAILHDIIPIKYPQYCTDDTRNKFAKYLNLISGFTGIIGNSKSTIEEYKEWRKNNINTPERAFHMDWFHLGANPKQREDSMGIPEDANDIFEAMTARPSLLEVSTVEPRKGHKQALDAFELLWAKGIDINFVIVGKLGWRMEDFWERVQKHPEFGRRLFWLQGISDEYLNKIYSVATGILMPSEAEGFGLAVVEGALHEKPLILRDIPVFREIAGNHATYFNGMDSISLSNCIEKWLDDLKRNEIPSSKEIKLLTWSESTQMLLSRLSLQV